MSTMVVKTQRFIAASILSVVLTVGFFPLAAPQTANAASGYSSACVASDVAKTSPAQVGFKAAAASSSKKPGVSYSAHEQGYGWMKAVTNGKVAGKAKKGLRAEALKISLVNKPYSGSIKYRSYGQNSGWSNWSGNGSVTGTTGKSLRLEAIQVKLTGTMSKKYNVYYSVYTNNNGWMGWAKNGASAGTFGQDRAIEAIKIKLVKKGSDFSGKTSGAFKTSYLTQYNVYVQSLGWKQGIRNGKQAGTTGADLRLEAFSLEVADLGLQGTVIYRAHMQGTGWTSWRPNGETVGAARSGRRLEALQIDLTNELAENYNIYYRMYVENYGWLDWAKNGQTAGTTGYGYRAEAVQVKLYKKKSSGPDDTEVPAYTK